MLDKTYRPEAIETGIYAAWERAGAMACGQTDGEPFTIVIPPPNVTGSLHMGHALNNTLQDILIRWRRMAGRDALWQPGSDHAGIATQMVVERQLAAEGKTRHDLGREKFIARVWDWKAESGGTIQGQLRRLGASCDWSRERFTMDQGLSRAVAKVFVDLYRDGLIYRDKRLVNWDCKLHTAISDLEVESREVQGKLWHIRYGIEGEADRTIVVATTRPETMLGDSGVAVHPDDERYSDLVGRHAILPLVGRKLPIVADAYADPDQCSGAVKMTPAHDFNDFEVGRRHDLALINIFDHDARTNDNVPEPYRGLDRFAARDKVVQDLEAAGLIERVEEITHAVPYGDRSGVVVEPWLTDQWFVDAKVLAEPAIAAVEQGRIRFVPEQWRNTYFDWMRNIQPWCISRQIWWGHQIPAWYGPDGTIFVDYDEASVGAQALAHYGEGVVLKRDPDVLDTWFSSALWPFSTLGWPDQTPELARYYPTDVLITGFDIIFFWVARMIMMGLYCLKEEPFHTVYIHALVRDAQGQKMSKSKGNIIDPLELIEKYGADALRFTLAAMAAQGRDIKLSEQRVEGYRNFGTKLWNAARFADMNQCRPAADFAPGQARAMVNRWIIDEAARTTAEVEAALEAYRFNDAAGAIYRFTWNTFFDWYLELAKPVLYGDDGAAKTETRAVTAWVLDLILRLLHPFMPYLTEHLWGELAPRADGALLITAAWPEANPSLVDEAAAAEISWLIGLVAEIRSVRAEANVPPSAELPLHLNGAGDRPKAWLADHWDLIARLARLSSYALDQAAPGGAIVTVFDDASVVLPVADVIDIQAERQRLAREVDRVEAEIASIDAKLANRNFVTRAPGHVVDQQRERRDEAQETLTKLSQAVARLSAA